MTTTTTRPVAAADMADGHPHRFAEIRVPAEGAKLERWVGCCKACKAAVRLEGTATMARERVYSGAGEYTASAQGFTLTAVIAGERVYTTRVLNDHALVIVRCPCSAFAAARRVYDGGKPDSKRHVCGARCTGATGPACDCKCRGANHGSGR